MKERSNRWISDVRSQDKPLQMCFDVKNKEMIIEYLRAGGLPRLKTDRWVAAQLGILAEAFRVYICNPLEYISYSRASDYYNKKSRYYGLPFSLRIVTNAIDQAGEYGLLENRIESTTSDRQSTFRATPKLVKLFADVEFQLVYGDVIRLREEIEVPAYAGKGTKMKNVLVAYDDDETTNRMRQEIETINAFMKTFDLQWPGVFQDGETLLNQLGRYVLFDGTGTLITDLRVQRSFCRGSFDCGGRCYGWWQNQPKALRPRILLNGEAVVEPDFSQLHPHMLYALRDVQLEHDAYVVEGFSRDIMKTALLTLINAPSEQSARRAIREMYRTKKLKYEAGLDKKLVAAVRKANPLIADDICSDKGVMLMRKDSDILVRAMLTLTNEKIPFLPVHDSIICRCSDLQRVKAVMAESYETEFPGFKCLIKS